MLLKSKGWRTWKFSCLWKPTTARVRHPNVWPHAWLEPGEINIIQGEHVWLRRSRYVAREFAWLSPDRQDLFSPASSVLTVRLFPTLYMKCKLQLCTMCYRHSWCFLDGRAGRAHSGYLRRCCRSDNRVHAWQRVARTKEWISALAWKFQCVAEVRTWLRRERSLSMFVEVRQMWVLADVTRGRRPVRQPHRLLGDHGNRMARKVKLFSLGAKASTADSILLWSVKFYWLVVELSHPSEK